MVPSALLVFNCLHVENHRCWRLKPTTGIKPASLPESLKLFAVSRPMVSNRLPYRYRFLERPRVLDLASVYHRMTVLENASASSSSRQRHRCCRAGGRRISATRREWFTGEAAVKHVPPPKSPVLPKIGNSQIVRCRARLSKRFQERHVDSVPLHSSTPSVSAGGIAAVLDDLKAETHGAVRLSRWRISCRRGHRRRSLVFIVGFHKTSARPPAS